MDIGSIPVRRQGLLFIEKLYLGRSLILFNKIEKKNVTAVQTCQPNNKNLYVNK